jgi:RNA polymerase sigma-70 factor (ECF subfamily)
MTTDPRDGTSGRARTARMDPVSFEEFFRRYWPSLVRFLKLQAHNSRFAEDVASEAMIAAADKWDDLLTYDRPDCWLFNAAIRMLRRLEARARRDGWLCEDPETLAKDLRDESLRDEWVEAHVDVMAAVRLLPRRQSEVITTHYLLDRTIADTARILDMPVGTVKAHLNAGLVALRKHFEVSAPQKSRKKVSV